jgi:F0F1-type ATP synthase beta subunit
VRGSVVDIRFEGYLPPIYSLLRAGDEGRIVIEVLAQRDARCVRGIRAPPALARRSTKSEIFETGIKNIEELLEDLNRTFHRLRQSGTDEDLFDVFSGFVALYNGAECGFGANH